MSGKKPIAAIVFAVCEGGPLDGKTFAIDRDSLLVFVELPDLTAIDGPPGRHEPYVFRGRHTDHIYQYRLNGQLFTARERVYEWDPEIRVDLAGASG